MIGQTVSHYRILRLLGRGGMGDVYLAENTRLGLKVALKFLAPDLAADPQFLRRQRNEASAAAALHHDSIAGIHDLEVADGRHFLVLEYVEGQTLEERLARGPLPFEEAVRIGQSLADGLAHAHQHGILHRDVKPANVMLTPGRGGPGGVKILDFGLAKRVHPKGSPQAAAAAAGESGASSPGGDAQLQTETGVYAVVGTPAYMSPEQALGLELDARTDLFSLGLVLYQMVTGRQAFSGATAAMTREAILTRSPVPVRRIAATVPADMARIIDKALEKDIGLRYQTASDLHADLARLRRDIESHAAAGTPAGRRTAASSRLGWGRSAVVVTLVAMAGALVYLRRDAISPWLPWTRPDVQTIAVVQDGPPELAADVESLGEGIVQNLTDGLCQLPQVAVVSHAGTSDLHLQAVDFSRIREDFGADALLAVRVAQQGVGYEVRVRLVETRTLRHLWGATYTRRSRDVADVVESVSRDVIEALQLRLNAKDRSRLEAYRLYQKGRYYLDKRSAEGLRNAVELYGQAIRIDPSYAPAHAGLANCYSLLSYYGGVSPAESFPKAEAAALRALELDETLADAHTALALVLRDYKHAWAAAEREFERAIELNPKYATAYQWYAEYLAALGRRDDAIRVMKRARELAPLEPIIAADLGWVYYLARRPDDAIVELTRTIEREPDFAPAHWFLGLAYAQAGSLDKAIASAETAVRLSGGSTRIVADLAVLHARAGNRALAESLLGQLRQRAEGGGYVSPYELALVNVGLGRYDLSFDLLDQAFRDRRWELVNLNVDPMLDPLRNDQRFASLVRRMGFLL